MRIGIDASRNRSGGAKAHIIGVLNDFNEDFLKKKIEEIHVWSYHELLNSLPNKKWLIKHTSDELNKSIFHQLWWQYKKLPVEARNLNIDILLNTDAGTVCRFKPSVTMSRDMLSYEKGEMKRFGFSLQRLRLIILKHVQNYSLKNASAAIFLTKYAADIIQKSSGKIKDYEIINHGIGDDFRREVKVWCNNDRVAEPVSCIYVSNVAPYKHQLYVAKAVVYLRTVKNYNIKINFVGGGEGQPQRELLEFMKKYDSKGKFLQQTDFIKHSELPDVIVKSDLFIFASSCENMPNTLIEGMCSGLPIVCSDRGPMPEILKDGGVYFNPEDSNSIADAIELMLMDEVLRKEKAVKSFNYSKKYSWKKCSEETFNFLINTIKRY